MRARLQPAQQRADRADWGHFFPHVSKQEPTDTTTTGKPAAERRALGDVWTFGYSISVTRYGAFLRGINVGTTKRVKMEDLRRVISELGFSRVETYIQSGNIFFDSSQQNIPRMTALVEQSLHR